MKSYYSVFHAARAVVYSLGYREKARFAISIVLRELEKQDKLEPKYTLDFEAYVEAREDADYRLEYSEERAKASIKMAGRFLERMKGLMTELAGERTEHGSGKN